MTTYHCSIYKENGHKDYTGFSSYNGSEFQLEGEKDFAHAKQLCENRKNMAGFWKQTVLPIRANLASDFFLPTLMNMVMKTKEYAGNAFLVIMAIVWDLATLPIRLITFLPWAAYNAMAKPVEHPLMPYLREKMKSETGIITSGRVNVLLYEVEIEGGIEHNRCHKYELYLTDREIAFPIYKQSSQFSKRSLNGKPIIDQLINSRVIKKDIVM